MSRLGLHVENVAEFAQAFNRAIDTMEDGARDGLKTSAGRVQDRAEAKVRQRTGRLARSLRGGPDAIAPGGIRLGADNKGLYAEVGTGLFYGRFLEGGTKHMKPRRFIRPAMFATRREFRNDLGTRISARLNRRFPSRRR